MTTSRSLRRLVQEPKQLVVTAASGNDHPLGVGIDRRVAFLHAEGKVPLPVSGRAFEELESALEHAAPPPVAAHLHPAAWAAALSKPTLTLSLRPPAAGPGSAAGLASEGAPELELRSLALLTVLETPEDSGAVAGDTAMRIGAGLTLTVAHDSATKSSERAWLRASWLSSTAGMLSWVRLLAPSFHERTPFDLTTSLTFLVHPAEDYRFEQAWNHIRLTSQLLGIRPQVIRRNVDSRSITTMLSRSGSRMLAVGEVDDGAKEIVAAFKATAPGKVAQFFVPSGQRALTDELDEQLLIVAGLNPALYPLAPQPAPAAVVERRPPIPITEPAECVHRGNRFYLLDRETGLWWTRDDTGHADTVFKTYTKVSGSLVHNADHDAHGGLIHKHKGEEGMEIDLTETHACGKNPVKHLA